MYERRVRMTPSPVGRCRQRGYLQEVPIVLAIVGVLLAVGGYVLGTFAALVCSYMLELVL